MTDPFDLSTAADDEAVGPTSAPGGYLTALNATQAEAVEATEGPLLVLAGAGTGKTRVLTTRLAHILLTARAWPSQLLAVTFTNKAARQMKDRVATLIERNVDHLWLGTFHAVAARILRRHAELVGLKSNFTIIDSDDQIRLIKQVLADYNIDEKKWPARGLQFGIERWKDRGLTPDQAKSAPESDAAAFAQGRGVALYRAYQDRLSALNVADFGDLLLHCLTLFTAHPEVLERWQKQFHYILVDEYQDTNVVQYLWLRLLAQSHRNLCCVGDDDQSIYSWRGAEVANILRFEKDFPGARIIRLERNYRSTGHILGAASGLIAHNVGRLGKTLWTDPENSGGKVVVRGVWDDDEEARVVGERVEALRWDGGRLDQCAVLVRAGFQTRAFEERFITIGLPYKVVGGLRFYERREIRDAVAYMRLIIQADNDLAFERIVNVPKRGLGVAGLRLIHARARAQGISLARAAGILVETDEMRPKPRAALKALTDGFERWRGLLENRPHGEVVGIMLEESGYSGMWRKDKSVGAPGRLENLRELERALGDFETLDEFLEHISLVMDMDSANDSDLVNIMTLHSAKGLEFDSVFLPGWEEGLFPHERALQENGGAGLEEERRLAYVGLTRARKRVEVLFAANRRIYSRWQSCLPSRFVDELPEAHVLRSAPMGLSGGSGRDAVPAPRGVARQSPRQTDGFSVGTRIFHQKFGYGCILSSDGDRLEIAFEKAGVKKLIDRFVEGVDP